MNNFDEVMELIARAEKLIAKVDESFQRMSRGGIVNTSWGSTLVIGNLKKANSIFKKLDKLTREAGDSYTPEQAQMIEAKAKELTARYDLYLQLVNQANEIAKGFLKASGKVVVDTVKGTVTSTIGGIGKKDKKGQGVEPKDGNGGWDKLDASDISNTDQGDLNDTD